MRRIFLATAAAFLMGTIAQAQLRGDGCPNVNGTLPKGEEPVRTIVLPPTDVIGCVAVPGIKNFTGRPKPKFSSLIKARANFMPELQKSVDQL